MRNMASLKGDGTSLEPLTSSMENNFVVYMFTFEMGLAFVDVWDIKDVTKKPPRPNVDPKAKKEYKRHVKKTMLYIAFNLADRQFLHIKSYKGPTKAWNTLCNIYKMRTLSNFFFFLFFFFFFFFPTSVVRKFFMRKMEEIIDLLDHINKITHGSTCFFRGAHQKWRCCDDFVWPSYEYLITALETMPMKDLTMKYVWCTRCQREEERAQRWWCYNGVASRQKWIIYHDTKTSFGVGKDI